MVRAPHHLWIGLLGWLATTSPAGAEPPFPRGPGFYLNLPALVAVVLVYLLWIRTCAWVDCDAARLGLNRARWNLLMLAGGVAGALLFWIMPFYFFGLAFLLLCAASPFVYYVFVRNALVPESKQVFTEQHFQRLVRRFIRTGAAEEPASRGPDIHFFLSEGEGDASQQLKEIQKLAGFRPAADVLCRAVARRASDIQFEPARGRYQIRLRIDGHAHVLETRSRADAEQFHPVYKRLAGLDVNERRKPQSGEFSARIGGKRFDFTIQSGGTIAGERLSIHVGDRTRPVRSLEELGMRPALREQLTKLLQQPRGLLILCGPADSGRTTTAYACLMELHRLGRGVLTIEQAIEQRLPHIEQYRPISRTRESLAAAAKRVLAKVDANALYLSDLPDAETAALAYERAKEGRIVIAAIEADDTMDAVAQLRALGLSASRLSRMLIGVLAQRLVRRLCPECKVPYKPDEALLKKNNWPVEKIKVFQRPPEPADRPTDATGQPAPCEACQGLGYRDRLAIFQLLSINDRLKELLREGAPLATLRREAVKSGMADLRDEAMPLVVDGITAIPEILQVLRLKSEASAEPSPALTPGG
jgi:type II secretory ATPase GspE/PulE/Tfp pilus assembly ATPase PilB-like protein